jgi:hypothetical protein
MAEGLPVTLDLPPAALEAIAQRAAAVVLEQLRAQAPERADGYLRPDGAADYLGLSRKRVHDLTSMGALVPDGRDGRTPLYTRATLDAYVRSQAA